MTNDRTPVSPQSSPKPESVVDDVMRDLEGRRSVGRQRYGVELTTHNGRDALLDAYEEALDLSCYLKQAMLERGRTHARSASPNDPTVTP